MFKVLYRRKTFQIDRFTTLSDLYTSFGFDRKASFCLRLAATRHVSQNNPNPDWQQCYNLMLQATSGFKLSLDPVDMPPGNCCYYLKCNDTVKSIFSSPSQITSSQIHSDYVLITTFFSLILCLK